jgi:hypothetical protein
MALAASWSSSNFLAKWPSEVSPSRYANGSLFHWLAASILCPSCARVGTHYAETNFDRRRVYSLTLGMVLSSTLSSSEMLALAMWIKLRAINSRYGMLSSKVWEIESDVDIHS